MDTYTQQVTTRSLGRRAFLRGLGGGAVILAGGGVLAACGGAASGGSSASASSSAAALQLCYLKNVQFAGSLVADNNGFYKKAGLDVTITAGGPNLAVEPVVQSGKALLGITHTAQAINAIDGGADLVVIGAGYQKNPFCIVSKADAPISGPADLVGRKIGVSAANLPVWQAFLKANGIDESTVKVVTIAFDPTPLASGEVDGFVAFYTNEPSLLEAKGVKTKTFLLNDAGYPLLEDVYVAKKSTLNDKDARARLVSFMTAEAQGWQAAIADPTMAATLAVTKYGVDLKLDQAQQVKQANLQNELVVSSVTKEHGLFWMSDADIASTVRSLTLGGANAKTEMFTNSVLQEVFAKGPTV